LRIVRETRAWAAKEMRAILAGINGDPDVVLDRVPGAGPDVFDCGGPDLIREFLLGRIRELRRSAWRERQVARRRQAA
jgi:hypothetical protein